jgi:O-methyltransferase involved in polyketide biosynthesis
MNEIEKTLAIPLAARARESRKPDPILSDQRADAILSSLAIGPEDLRIPRKSEIMVLMRAKQFDSFASRVLDEHPGAMVLHLGCGLDARYERVGTPECKWYDVDLSEVIKVRRTFFEEDERYSMIGCSVTDPGFLDEFDFSSSHVLCMAEGLLMYLGEEQVRTLITGLSSRCASMDLIFDAFSSLTARHVGAHPSLSRLREHAFWGIDDPSLVHSWDENLSLHRQWHFNESEDIPRLSMAYSFMFKASGCFKAARNAHRILWYKAVRNM